MARAGFLAGGVRCVCGLVWFTFGLVWFSFWLGLVYFWPYFGGGPVYFWLWLVVFEVAIIHLGLGLIYFCAG